jgi:hypothetical protein
MRVLSALALPLLLACAGVAADPPAGESKPAAAADGAQAGKPDPAVVGDWVIEQDGHSLELILAADGTATGKKDGADADKTGTYTTKDGILTLREGDSDPESIGYKAEKDQLTLSNPKDGMTLVLKRAATKPAQDAQDAPATDAAAPAAK